MLLSAFAQLFQLEELKEEKEVAPKVEVKADSLDMAVGQNLRVPFWDGYHPTIVFFKGFLRSIGGTGFWPTAICFGVFWITWLLLGFCPAFVRLWLVASLCRFYCGVRSNGSRCILVEVCAGNSFFFVLKFFFRLRWSRTHWPFWHVSLPTTSCHEIVIFLIEI